jgi:hypothetical protein
VFSFSWGGELMPVYYKPASGSYQFLLLGVSLECGGLAPLCYRAERGSNVARSARDESGARPPHSKEAHEIN